MAAEKISLSLDADLVAKARKVAGPRGLSALVSDALRIRARQAWPDVRAARPRSRRSA